MAFKISSELVISAMNISLNGRSHKFENLHTTKSIARWARRRGDDLRADTEHNDIYLFIEQRITHD